MYIFINKCKLLYKIRKVSSKMILLKMTKKIEVIKVIFIKVRKNNKTIIRENDRRWKKMKKNVKKNESVNMREIFIRVRKITTS